MSWKTTTEESLSIKPLPAGLTACSYSLRWKSAQSDDR